MPGGSFINYKLLRQQIAALLWNEYLKSLAGGALEAVTHRVALSKLKAFCGRFSPIEQVIKE